MPLRVLEEVGWLGQVSNKCPFGLSEQTLGKMAVGKPTIRRTVVGKTSIIQKITRQIDMVSQGHIP